MDIKRKTIPDMEYMHVVAYAKREGVSFEDTLLIALRAMQKLMPRTLAAPADLSIYASSQDKPPGPWEAVGTAGSTPYAVHQQVDSVLEHDYAPLLNDDLRDISKILVQSRFRVRGWGYYAYEWSVSIDDSHPNEPERHIAVHVMMNAKNLLHEVAEDECLASTPDALMRILADVSDCINAYGGFIDCTHFTEDASGTCYRFSPIADNMSTVPVFLEFERWSALGKNRKDRVRSVHWANLLTWPVLERLGGKDQFVQEFNDLIQSYSDNAWYFRECGQGLIVRLGPSPFGRMIGGRDLTAQWWETGPWLYKKLANAQLLV